MAQTEAVKAYSELCLRFDTMLGETIGGTMSAAGITTADQVIFCISRNTTTATPTDRLTTITVTGTGGAFTSSANLSALPVEILWHDTSA